MAKPRENLSCEVGGWNTRQHVCIDQRVMLSFFLLPHIQESAMFVLVSNCSVSTKCMTWKLKQAWKRCRVIPKDSGASTWYNVLLVVVGVGDCADRMRGFGIPRLRLFVILAKVVHFLILLQVSAGGREGGGNAVSSGLLSAESARRHVRNFFPRLERVRFSSFAVRAGFRMSGWVRVT